MKRLVALNIGIEIWWNKHAETGAPILSYAHPDSFVKVIPDIEWFDRDYSFVTLNAAPEQPVMPRVLELMSRIPVPAMRHYVPPKNSIAVVALGIEDSFMVFGFKGRRTLYSYVSSDVDDSVDIVFSRNITQCDHLVRSFRLHNVTHGYECIDCLNSAFLFDCKNCKNCFGASNQRNKQYLWFNEQLSKDEWERRRSEVDLGCRSQVKRHADAFDRLLLEDSVWPESFNEAAIDSIGDYLRNCTDCRYCFLVANNSVHNFWCAWGTNANGNAFCAGPLNATDCYMSNVPGYCTKVKFSWKCARSDTVEYSINCFNCKNCFGCVGLQRKEFYIFNRPYPENDYWKIVDEIKSAMLDRGEYGRFFPLSFASAHTKLGGAVINTLFNPDDLVRWGATNFEPCSDGACGFEEKDITSMRKREEIPDCIAQMDDGWIGASIYDADAKRRFSFLKPELEFYRQERVPAPTTHFTTRISNLYYVMQSPVFEERACNTCGMKFTTTVNVTYPDRKILCRACYLTFIESRS
jgi:hypothetical protein